MTDGKFEYNKYRGKEVRVACGTCNVPTYHTVESCISVTETVPEVGVTTWTNYEMLSCRGCRTVSFRILSRNSEEDYYDPDTGQTELIESESLYPSRIAGQAPLRDAYLLPHRLYRIYRETHQALSSNMPILAGIGLRAIIETVCEDRSAKGKSLLEKIDDLVSQGVLTKAGAGLLHTLRVMGNEAVHEVKPHKTEDLSTALGVVEHTRQGVYIIPKNAASLSKRVKPELSLDDE